MYFLPEASEKDTPRKLNLEIAKRSELTISSEVQRQLRRKFESSSNFVIGEKLARAKEKSSIQLSDSMSKWLSCFLSNLGNEKAETFGRRIELYSMKRAEVGGLIRSKTGELTYTNRELCLHSLTTRKSLKRSTKETECLTSEIKTNMFSLSFHLIWRN